MPTPNVVDSFIDAQWPTLTGSLAAYLRGEVGHGDMQRCADKIFDAWDRFALTTLPISPREQAFWCAMWTVQHLASPGHWRDGIAPRDLAVILDVLEGRAPLPNGWTGRRP